MNQTSTGDLLSFTAAASGDRKAFKCFLGYAYQQGTSPENVSLAILPSKTMEY